MALMASSMTGPSWALHVDRLVDADVEQQILRRCVAHLDADHADEVAWHFVRRRLLLGVDVPPDDRVIGDERVARSLCHLGEPDGGELALDRRHDLASTALSIAAWLVPHE